MNKLLTLSMCGSFMLATLTQASAVFAADDTGAMPPIQTDSSLPPPPTTGWIGQPPLIPKTPRTVTNSSIYTGADNTDITPKNPLPPSLLKKPADGGWVGQPSLVIKPRQDAITTASQNNVAPVTTVSGMNTSSDTFIGQPPLLVKHASQVVAAPPAPVVPQNNVAPVAVSGVVPAPVPTPVIAAPVGAPPPAAVISQAPPAAPAIATQTAADTAQAAAVPAAEVPIVAPVAAAAAVSPPPAPKTKAGSAQDVVAFYPKQPINEPPQAAPAQAAASADAQKKTTAPTPVAAAVADTPPLLAVAIPEKIPTQRELQDGTFVKSLSGNGLLPLDIGSTTAPDVDKPVRLDEAVAMALTNNFEVQASDESLDGAHWQKLGSYSEYVPSVEINMAEGREDSSPAAINDANGNRVLENVHHRTDSSISIRQPLIDLSAIGDMLKSHANENIAETDLRDTREGIAYDTVNSFMKLTQARIAIKLADQYKAYLDDLSKRMTARVEGGGATSADLDRIKSRSTLAESARIEALGEYDSNLSEFRRITHITPSQLKIPDVLVPTVPANSQDAFQSAMVSNPAYLSSLRKIDAAEAARNKSVGDLAPKLSVEYTKTRTFNADGAAEGNPVDGVYPTQDEQRVMLVAHWLLSGGTTIAEGLEGAAKAREQRLRSQDVRARLEQAIHTSYNAINASSKRINILQQAIEADTRVVKDFEEQYKNGTRSLFDLLDAYEHLYSAQLDLMRLTIAKAQASYQVRRQMGELVPAIMSAEAH